MRRDWRQRAGDQREDGTAIDPGVLHERLEPISCAAEG
jgi:hypothetical protein